MTLTIGDLAALSSILALLFAVVVWIVSKTEKDLSNQIQSTSDKLSERAEETSRQISNTSKHLNHKIEDLRHDMDGLISRVERHATERMNELEKRNDELRGMLFDYQQSVKDSCTQLMERIGIFRAAVDTFPQIYAKREELNTVRTNLEHAEKKIQELQTRVVNTHKHG